MINLVTLHWECRMSVMLVINHSFIIATRFIFRGGGAGIEVGNLQLTAHIFKLRLLTFP